jgi:hypothetical protein
MASWFCPGCRAVHTVLVNRNGAYWWNRSTTAPTISPAVQLPGCHAFLTGGNVAFLGTSTHHLRNKTVTIPEWTQA